MSQSAIQKPSLNPQTASNADVEADGEVVIVVVAVVVVIQ
jgi:hypothetical protein